jgi:quercetin dioxygenase-like cupin family protein
MKNNMTAQIIRAKDGESKLFNDGSVLVRPQNLPWTPIPGWAEGIDFKLLNIVWDRHIYVVILRLAPGCAAVGHYHYGVAHAWVLEGDFTYEYGDVVAGSYLYEESDLVHEAVAGDRGTTVMAVMFDGIGPVGDDGRPDKEAAFDCMSMYLAAKENGGADHVPPPPAAYKKLDLWQHAAQYELVA